MYWPIGENSSFLLRPKNIHRRHAAQNAYMYAMRHLFERTTPGHGAVVTHGDVATHGSCDPMALRAALMAAAILLICEIANCEIDYGI